MGAAAVPRRPAWTWILTCLLCFCWQAASAQDPLILASPRGETILQTVRIEGELYVPLVPLVERTGLELEWDSVLRRMVLLRDGQECVTALVEAPLYRVSGRFVQERQSPRFFEGALYLPVEVLREALTDALQISFVATPTPTQTPWPTATPPPGPTPPWEILPVPMLPLRFAMPEDLYNPPLVVSEPLPVATPGEKFLVVVLDPAGGGPEPRGAGPLGINEAEWVYDLAVLLKRRLENSLTVRVVLTRDPFPDHEASAEERAMRANSAGGILLLSLHLGGGFSEQSEGFSLFHMTELIDDREPYRFDTQGRPKGKWAQAVQYDWESAYLPYVMDSSRLAKTLRKYLDRELRTPDRGLRPARLTLLRSVQMPAAWVELGVPSNRRDAARLQDVEYQQRLVEALYLALREYLEGIPAGSAAAASTDRNRP